MALHLPIGPLNPALGWSRYRDTNPVPTNPLADDITTCPLGPVTAPLGNSDLYSFQIVLNIY